MRVRPVLMEMTGDDTQVFINDSSETIEVTSVCCHKFKIELRSAQKTIELLHAQSYPPEEILSNIKIEPDDSELELQIALKKACRLKLQETVTELKNSVGKVAESVLKRNSEGNMEGGSSVLNATAEFCCTLGDIPIYGLADN
ncbi:U4/U6.U5 tri-snRNP-associated protein 1-like [Cryptotermes secundus]|uniref:U4/U6.U5 tri-snRNP-associated protein 1-like n=1 Tax=Cryptotermes secundus TaxID=105785 RepID=UPI000CD7B986|nr:U4/U6.U5 tri-snRNP-associated protein 1-like [Cryptotermes secundus]